MVLQKINSWRMKSKYSAHNDGGSVETLMDFSTHPQYTKASEVGTNPALDPLKKKRSSFRRRFSLSLGIGVPDDDFVTNKTPVTEVVVNRELGQKMGVVTKRLHKRLIVALVCEGSAAHKAGIEMGDEILQYGDKTTVGMYPDTFARLLRNDADKMIRKQTQVLKRQCPFLTTERLYLPKPCTHGMDINDGIIVSIATGSAGEFSKLHHGTAIVAIDDKNVMGMQDDEISALLNECVNDTLIATISAADKKFLLKGIDVLPQYKLLRQHSSPQEANKLDQHKIDLAMNGFFVDVEAE